MSRLSNNDLSRFLDQGYLILELDDVDGAIHEHLHNQAAERYGTRRKVEENAQSLDLIADDTVAGLPALDHALGSARVDAALCTVLGANYFRYPHAFIHESSANDQDYHKDSSLPWGLRSGIRSHRPNWAMGFYYPQATTLELGPTELVPGTQYWNVDHEIDGYPFGEDRLDRDFLREKTGSQPDLDRRDTALARALRRFDPGSRPLKVEVDAGAFVLVHFDLIHRGTRRSTDAPRYLYKFWYARTMEPRTAERMDLADPLDPRRRPIVNHLAEWLLGRPRETTQQDRPIYPDSEAESRADSGANSGDDSGDNSGDKGEAERIEHAYQLGFGARDDDDLLASLNDGLISENEATRRAATYGLAVTGARALPAAYDALNRAHPGVRKSAAFVMGELGVFDVAAVDALARLVADDDVRQVRAAATTALGLIARRTLSLGNHEVLDAVVPVLVRALDSDAQPDLRRSLVPMSPVRQAAALALLACSTEISVAHTTDHPRVAQIVATLARAVEHDTDRYVAGTAREALRRLSASAEP